jgi:Xaa-Pro aminopeptidase
MTMDRPDRVADRLAERDLDALLVTNLVNVFWLTGFTGSSGLAIVGAGGGTGERLFYTDFRYLSQSAEQVAGGWAREIAQELLPAAGAALAATAAGSGKRLRVGFDDADLSVKDHGTLAAKVADGVELVPAGGLLEELRAIKDPAELEAIRAATRLADAALTEVLTRGLAGRTERDVAIDLEFTMRRMGAKAPSFPSIIASGTHSALPHAVPRDVEIPKGTLVTIDWGAQLDGYASDCTRTYATGELDPRDREIYDLVLEAQETSLAAVRAGASARDVDAVAREIITAAGHGEHFGHGLGHGVGAEVHEGPRLSQRSEATLESGQVVTVEPGVYVPGAVGVRIEDLAVVTDDGAEILTGLPKHLQVIE